MNEYISYIEHLDLEDSSELINNSSTDHAIPLIARLVARGRKEIRLLTGSLSPKIYTDKSVLDALGVFLLGRSGSLKIVVLSPSAVTTDDAITKLETSLLAKLKTEFGSEVTKNIEIIRATDNVRATVKGHFLVVDDKGFRFEPNQAGPDHKAVASFNLPDVAGKLSKAFDGYFSTGHSIASC